MTLKVDSENHIENLYMNPLRNAFEAMQKTLSTDPSFQEYNINVNTVQVFKKENNTIKLARPGSSTICPRKSFCSFPAPFN